jgi:hypothetical protein
MQGSDRWGSSEGPGRQGSYKQGGKSGRLRSQAGRKYKPGKAGKAGPVRHVKVRLT